MRFLLPRLGVRPQEAAAVGWSWLFFFCVLSAYYVIRPIRDAMGVAGGVDNLPWLFTSSLIGMLLVNPPFAWLAARLPRPRFVSAAYRFFAINLLGFFAVLHLLGPDQQIWAGRVFFVWTSVFNMFVVSIFWSVMADAFTTEQGQRLFGLVGAAGTVGAITGAATTSLLVGPLGAPNLMLVSVALLELAALAARRLLRFASVAHEGRAARVSAADQATGMGGGVWDGMRRTLTNAYFVNITLQMLLFTVLTTFLYFQQAELVDQTLTDSATRTQFFANIDLLVNVITLTTQTLATGWFIRAFGVTAALAFLPVLSVLGFGVLGLVPTIGVLMAFQVGRRAGNFAVNRPAREVLFTVVSPADRYKTKGFIDTFVYRAGDQLGAWAYAPMAAMGLGIPGISAVGAGLAMLSVVNAVWLGRRLRQAGATAALAPPVLVEPA